MVQTLAQYWWLTVLRGVLSIIFGIIAFVYPASTLASLILFFGIWMIVDGSIAIVNACMERKVNNDWVIELLFGLLGILFGAMVLSAPDVTSLVLVVYAGVWFIIRGIGSIVFAIKLRKVLKHEFLLIISGFLSVFVGFMLLRSPTAGAFALMWIIGAYAIILGGMEIALGIKFHSLKKIAS